MKKRLLCLLLVWLLLFTCACGAPQQTEESQKLQVVTTLFPYYDFVRAIGGERVEPTLLLPPGMEPHSFEPTPLDVVTLSRADVLIYNGGSGELWVEEILGSAQQPPQQVLCAMEKVEVAE
jgi:zinc transport system substrate-binding protein